MLSMFQELSRLATYGRCRDGGWGTSGRVFGFPLPSQQDACLGMADIPRVAVTQNGCISMKAQDPSASRYMPALPSSCSASRSVQLTHTFACMLTCKHTHNTNTCTYVHVNMCTHIHMHAHTETHMHAVFLH